MTLYLPKYQGNLADAVTESGKSLMWEMIAEARRVTPALMAIDLTEMGYRGCDCMLTGIGTAKPEAIAFAEDLTARLPHHVDLAFGTPGWSADSAAGETWREKRADIENWCFENVRGAYNEFRTCRRNENGVAVSRVWRWAFSDPAEAVAFALRWR